jgi:Alkylmercury lyase
MPPPAPDFDPSVRLAIMEALLGGSVPTVASVSSALGAAPDDVAAAVDRLAAGRAIVLRPGSREILMAAPLAGVRTEFSVRVGEQPLYANCIWDAVGVPVMLAGAARPADVTIETRCADCAEVLKLEVRDGRLTTNPPDAVAHFAVPAGRWWADIVFT